MPALATTTDLANYLQRSDVPAGTATLALDGASQLVRTYCGWQLDQVTETLHAFGAGTQVLSLPTLHLTAVAEVRLAGEVLVQATVDEGAPFAAAEYVWTVAGQLVRPASWDRFAAVEADVTHGYSPVPDDVRVVVLAVAARLVSNPDNLRQEVVGSVSRSWDSGMVGFAPTEVALLAPYRLP